MNSEKDLLKSPNIFFKPSSKSPSPLSSPKKKHLKMFKPKKKLCYSASQLKYKQELSDLDDMSDDEMEFNKQSLLKIKKEIRDINQNIKMILVKEKSCDGSDENIKLSISEIIKKAIYILLKNFNCCVPQIETNELIV
jgi:hypothetical protein